MPASPSAARDARTRHIEGAKATTRPPDIAVEVRSPGQSRPEPHAKVDLYRDFSVTSIWLIDPERLEVEVFESGTRQVLGLDDDITSTVVPGFRLGVRDLFERARVIGE